MSTIEGVLNAVVERLAKEYKPEQVILYGSYAYGEPHKHSDLDLFIVKEPSSETEGNYYQRWRIVEELLTGIPNCPAIQAFVLTPREVQWRLEHGDQFIEIILDKGHTLLGGATYYRPERTHEMDIAYARSWFREAQEDLETCELLLSSGRVRAALHLQQAVEKYLKAYLISKDWRLERTHDLPGLLTEAIVHHASLESYREGCEEVSKFYLGGRYPTEPGRLNPLGDEPLTVPRIRKALNQVRGLIDFIRDGLAEHDSTETETVPHGQSNGNDNAN